MIAYKMERLSSEMFKFWSVMVLRIVLTDGRVVCQDPNATPWKALGYSCPVNCHNVQYAIERLKMSDYENLLAKDVTIRADLSSTKPVYSSIEAHIRKTNGTEHDEYNEHEDAVYENRKTFNFVKKSKYDTFKEFSKLLQNKKVLTDFEVKVQKKLATNVNCSSLFKKASLKPHLLKHILGKCSRRSNDVEYDFLYTLTEILNKHTKKIRFNMEMTRILLQKIIGGNMDLRNGIFDIKKILNYLKVAIEKRERTSSTNVGILTLQLRSTHCLSAYVVGCFCKRGFVENSGRCVKPIDCTGDPAQDKYIARLFVH